MTYRDQIVEALIGQWAAIEGLVSRFDEAQWVAPTPCPGWTARDVVAHVIGTELMLIGEPAPNEDAPAAEYVHNDVGRANELWVQHFRGQSTSAVLNRFRAVTAARTRTLSAMTDAEFDAPSWTPEGPGTYARFMRIRLLDCWMHEQDLRDAVGLPGGEETTAAELALTEMIGKLGYVVGKQAAVPDGSTVTVKLTGPLERSIHVIVEGRARVVDQLPGTATTSLTLPISVFARRYGGRIPASAAADATRVDGDQLLGHRILDALAITF